MKALIVVLVTAAVIGTVHGFVVGCGYDNEPCRHYLCPMNSEAICEGETCRCQSTGKREAAYRDCTDVSQCDGFCSSGPPQCTHHHDNGHQYCTCLSH